VTNDLVFFAAIQDETGRELYAVPLAAESALIEFSGIALGGVFMITFSGASIAIDTLAGQSAGTVAANLAAAIDADPEAQTQDLSAVPAGSGLYVIGIGPAEVTWSTTDPGLGGPPVEVSAGSPVMRAATAVILMLCARLALRRRPRPRCVSALRGDRA